MSEAKPKFYLTTPIYYVNARPHIGHAYTTIVADVLARRHRLLGDETFFLTGTDEHGQKIERSAAAAGIPPQQFADQVAAEFKTLWDRMGITYDKFIRTTSPEHAAGVQKLWRELESRGFIYLSSYTGSYCVSDEAFVDAPAGTPCPDCGRLLETVTEENYFFKLSNFQEVLIDMIVSDEVAITPETAKNEVLSFLRGDLIGLLREPQLEDWVSAIGRFNLPELYEKAEQLGLLKRSRVSRTVYRPKALRDLSISRSSFKWGIPVPGDPKHVIYVWLDALANYITALGYGSDDTTNFEKFWPADLHLVGKEIIRFHCVYWPAFLLAAGLPLPKAITAHGWLLFDNSKMSKSKGNIVRTETILDAFGTLCPPAPPSELVIRSAARSAESKDLLSSDTPKPLEDKKAQVPQGFSLGSQPDKKEEGALAPGFSEPTQHDRDLFASDVLRYFLLREIPFGQDGSFSFDALLTRYNADLANGYGNLVSRTLGLIQQNFANGLPTPSEPWLCADKSAWRGNEVPTDEEQKSGTRFIISELSGLSDEENLNFLWDSHRFQILLAGVQLRISFVDGYLSFHKPWLLAKAEDETSKRKLIEVLYTAAESIRIITALLYPVMPYATSRVWAQLGLDPAELTTYNLELTTWGGLQPGTKLGPLSPVFPRADKSLIETMITMEEQNAPTTPAPATEATSAPQPPAPTELTTNNQQLSTVSIDDFTKIELRVAQIVVAERIPKADKLLRLEVDLGPDFPRRQILSGIAEHYTPEELIGRRIVVITNLAPRKMRGLESHGMLLAASAGENGKPILATFADSDAIALGSRLK